MSPINKKKALRPLQEKWTLIEEQQFEEENIKEINKERRVIEIADHQSC